MTRKNIYQCTLHFRKFQSLLRPALCQPFLRRIIVFETFRNIRKDLERFSDHSVEFVNLSRVFGQKWSFIDQNYLILHYLHEKIIIERPIAETFGMFRKVSETIILRENGHYLNFCSCIFFLAWSLEWTPKAYKFSFYQKNLKIVLRLVPFQNQAAEIQVEYLYG